jgi:hypothetical protein
MTTLQSYLRDLEQGSTSRKVVQEIREHQDDLILVLINIDDLNQTFLSVNKIKKKQEDHEIPVNLMQKYFLIHCFVHVEHGRTRGIEQSYVPIYLLLKFFLRLDNTILPLPSREFFNPFIFAKAFYEIYSWCGKVIHFQFIDSYLKIHMGELDQKTNLTQLQFEKLSELHQKFPEDKWKNEKNKNLVQFLKSSLVVETFHDYYTNAYCEKSKEAIFVELQKVFPDVEPFASSKEPYRIKQKYDDYCQNYLTPGVHAYKKFKDLYRTSMTYDDYIRIVESETFSLGELKISSINSTNNGNYRDVKVILNIKTFNVELKIANSLEFAGESHLWYELKRDPSISNLEEFIKRHVAKDEIVTAVKL